MPMRIDTLFKTQWEKQPHTPDYKCALTKCRAVYKRTEQGFGVYTIYTQSGQLYAIGGLPYTMTYIA